MDRRRGGWRRQVRRLVDPRVIGWPLFWFSYALFLLDALYDYLRAEPRTAMGAVTVVAAATAAQLATFAILLLAKHTYLRPRIARRHPSWTILSFVIATLVGGVVGRAVSVALQPDLVGRPEPDLFNHTVFQTITLCVLGIVVVALREHQADVAELAGARESLIATRASGERARVEEREQVRERVRELTEELTSTLPSSVAADASAALGHAAGDVIRPLSHELASSASDRTGRTVVDVPYPSWLETLRSVASGPPLIKPAIMGATTMILSARMTVSAPDPQVVPPGTQGVQVSVDLGGLIASLSQLLLVFAVVWFFARVAVWALRRLALTDGAKAWWATILATLGIAAASQVVLTGIFALAGFSLPVGTLANALLFTVSLLMVVLVVAVIKTTAARRQAAVAELARVNEDLDWEVRRTNELLWRQRRELSMWLHGPIQAALNAGAIQLAQDGAGQPEIDSAVTLFTEACAKVPSGVQSKDLEAELTAVRETWAPVCEITWHMEAATAERIGADPACAATLTDVIVEGCSNSVIHGGATGVEIEVEAEGERVVRLVLADNGTPAEDPTAGLGTQMLNDVCLAWTRDFGPDGTVLQARFPLSPGSSAGGPGPKPEAGWIPGHTGAVSREEEVHL